MFWPLLIELSRGILTIKGNIQGDTARGHFICRKSWLKAESGECKCEGSAWESSPSRSLRPPAVVRFHSQKVVNPFGTLTLLLSPRTRHLRISLRIPPFNTTSQTLKSIRTHASPSWFPETSERCPLKSKNHRVRQLLQNPKRNWFHNSNRLPNPN